MEIVKVDLDLLDEQIDCVDKLCVKLAIQNDPDSKLLDGLANLLSMIFGLVDTKGAVTIMEGSDGN